MTDKVQKIKEFLIGIACAACCDAKTKKHIENIILPFIDSLQEEPVSDDLEKAMQHDSPDNIGIDDLLYWRNGFIAGVKWEEELFEKNRIAACDKQTEEEAEREDDFVMGIIENEHRQPTFDDAIKYGMKKMKEQMMAKAIDGEVTHGKSLAIPSLGYRLDKEGFDFGDKVKVLVVKED